MKIKKTIGKFQVINWFKGAILAIIGLLHNRSDVGYNWFMDNLVIGPIVYLLIMISSMLVVFALKMPRDESENTLQKRIAVKIASIVIFLIAYGLISFYVYYYTRTLLLLVFLGLIGFCWGLSLLYGVEWEYKSILRILIIGFTLSFGVIYGALLNDLTFPIYLYFIILATFTLQISKDMLKSCKYSTEKRGEIEEYQPFADILTVNKTQRIVLILQILTLLFLTLPFITGVYNYFLYLFPMVIGVIFIIVSIVLNLKYDFEREYNGKIFILLRLSIFFAIMAFFLASV